MRACEYSHARFTHDHTTRAGGAHQKFKYNGSVHPRCRVANALALGLLLNGTLEVQQLSPYAQQGGDLRERLS